MNDVLNKCKEENYPVTASGLYYAGKKYGFLCKNSEMRNLKFDKDGFYEWLNKAKEEIPDGWKSINEIHVMFNISLSKAYMLCKNENSGAKSFGAGKGIVYVDPKRIEKLINEYKQSHKEKWD